MTCPVARQKKKKQETNKKHSRLSFQGTSGTAKIWAKTHLKKKKTKGLGFKRLHVELLPLRGQLRGLEDLHGLAQPLQDLQWLRPGGRLEPGQVARLVHGRDALQGRLGVPGQALHPLDRLPCPKDLEIKGRPFGALIKYGPKQENQKVRSGPFACG